jgi:hypothetical protein
MSISIKCMTAALKKSAIRRDYPGGLEGFRRDFLVAEEDFYLVAIRSMSGGELQETLDRIGQAGITLIDCCAVGAEFIGPIERHPHFEFTSTPGDLLPAWEVTGKGRPGFPFISLGMRCG